MNEVYVLSRIRKFREQLGYSQEAIADELGISRSAYANFEEGKVKIFCRTLEKMAEYANVSVSVVLYGKDFSPESEFLETQKSKEANAVIEQYKTRIRDLEADKRQLYLLLEDARDTIKTDCRVINYLTRDPGPENSEESLD